MHCLRIRFEQSCIRLVLRCVICGNEGGECRHIVLYWGESFTADHELQQSIEDFSQFGYEVANVRIEIAVPPTTSTAVFLP